MTGDQRINRKRFSVFCLDIDNLHGRVSSASGFERSVRDYSQPLSVLPWQALVSAGYTYLRHVLGCDLGRIWSVLLPK